MWWRNDDDQEVIGQIDVLHAAWRDGQAPQQVVAIGSTWSAGRRVPLVGVEAWADPRPAAWFGPGTVLARLAHRLGPLPGPPPHEERGARAGLAALGAARRGEVEPADLLYVTAQDADEPTREWVRSLPVSSDVLVTYLDRIRLTRRRGTSVRRGASVATAGCAFETYSGSFVATVGHLDARPGDRVAISAGRRLPGRSSQGTVRIATWPGDPSGDAWDGIDIALVEADPPAGLVAVDVARPQDLRSEQKLVWKGGQVGCREGWIADVFREWRDGPHRHRHTLRAIGPRSGAARAGDSGTAVYTTAGELVGHLVAVSGFRWRSVAQSALVQDAGTALAYCEAQVGIPRRLSGDRGRR